MNEKEKNSNITQIALISLLVIAAFFIGILSNKVTQLENNVGGNNVASDEGSLIAEEVEEFSVQEIAGMLGLDATAFDECLQSEDISQDVEDQFQSGVKAGVNGTPGNILLDTQTGLALNIAGALPIDMLESSLEDLKSGSGEAIDVDLVSEKDYVQGDRGARYVLFEYSDYECPYCSSFHSTAREFSEAHQEVAWVYRQFPLDQLHPNTRAKSEAALCAGQLGGNDAFWAFSDMLFGL